MIGVRIPLSDLVERARVISDAMILVEMLDAAGDKAKLPAPSLTPADLRIGDWRFVMTGGLPTAYDGMTFAPYEVRVFHQGGLFWSVRPISEPVTAMPEPGRSEMFATLALYLSEPKVQA